MEKWQQLRRRFLLTVPLDGHRSIELVALRSQLGEVSEQGHVRLVEELRLIAKPLEHRLDARTYVVELDQSFLESPSLFLGPGRDLGSETELRRFSIWIGCVARVSEVGQGRSLGEQRLESGPIGQPPLDVRGVERSRRKFLVVRQDFLPGRVF